MRPLPLIQELEGLESGQDVLLKRFELLESSLLDQIAAAVNQVDGFRTNLLKRKSV